MTADKLRILKQYMHIYHDDDDKLISKLWGAAASQLEKNGIDLSGDDAWLAAAGLTLQWYDGTPLQPGIRELLNGLKLEKPAF